MPTKDDFRPFAAIMASPRLSRSGRVSAVAPPWLIIAVQRARHALRIVARGAGIGAPQRLLGGRDLEFRLKKDETAFDVTRHRRPHRRTLTAPAYHPWPGTIAHFSSAMLSRQNHHLPAAGLHH